MERTRQFFFFTLFIFQGAFLLGQTVISGHVMDTKGASLPYVNIGIKGMNIGTCSTAEGRFSITIPENHKKDTLTFSMMGYEESKVPVSNLKSNGENTIQLKPASLLLTEVTISQKKTDGEKIWDYEVQTHHAF